MKKEKENKTAKEIIDYTKKQMIDEKAICEDSLKVLDNLKQASELSDDFIVNLSGLFNNLALINHNASVLFIPSLAEAFEKELTRLKQGIANAEKLLEGYRRE